jgi:hypothetical protein
MSIAEFLLARIAEDMTTIAGFPYPEESWHPWYEDSLNRLESNHDGLMIAPGRIFAECEAKRRIVAFHEPSESLTSFFRTGVALGEMPGCCQEDGERFPCRTLRALALPYADHESFQPEWRV